MRKILLMSSALAVFGFSCVAQSACIQTPTCGAMGYNSTVACEGGIKCPFGNAWNCTAADKFTELTDKITELETTIKKVQQGSNNENKVNCKVGDILYDDFSCNENVVYTKEPIGVVFDVTNYLAVSLEEKRDIAWSTTTFDIPGLDLHPYDARYDGWGKKNTRVIYEYCKANGKSCPAVEYAYEYKTAGTSAGDWHLPSFVELGEIFKYYDEINSTISKINKDQIVGSIMEHTRQYVYFYWTSTANSKENVYTRYDYAKSSGREADSSSEKKTDSYRTRSYTDSYGDYITYYYYYIARPVLAF